MRYKHMSNGAYVPLSSGFCVFRYSVTAISKSNVYTSKNWRGFRGVRLFIHSLEFSSFVVSFAFQSRKPPGGGSVVLGGGWEQFVVNWNSCVVCVSLTVLLNVSPEYATMDGVFPGGSMLYLGENMALIYT